MPVKKILEKCEKVIDIHIKACYNYFRWRNTQEAEEAPLLRV